MKKRTDKNIKNIKIVNLLVMLIAITIIFSFPKPSEGEVVSAAENTNTQVKNVGQPSVPKNIKEPVKKASGKKIAYLTIDDGPSYATNELLNLLAEYDVKATFFMLEPRMKQHSDTLNRMVKEGHALGMHGVTHDKNKFYKSKYTVVQEMTQGKEYIKKVTGTDAYLIRVPYGSHPHMKPSYIQAVKEAGFQMWDWNVDTRDWAYKDKRLATKAIEQIKNLQHRNIEPVILIHDMPTTVKNLRPLLEYLANNFEMRTLENIKEPLIFGSTTASKPKVDNGIRVTVPTFPVTINDMIVDNTKNKFPILIYKDITYLPLTWDYCGALGINITWDNTNGLGLSKKETASDILNQDLSGNNTLGKAYYAQLANLQIKINENNINKDEEYPFLNYKDITYMPLTWKYVTEEFGLQINWNEEKGLSIKK
ncbi:Peptidoglycan/xylan/chitin deacetylase, PgdA/CDA1 family [Desulfonispora thiosulfatigenes DSM 11270]|uniref:Peptidoglycan/xylan/chitin deacetylase, PgdA/CDA1 family n=1 Tax=Desulfonispora thiosulfatigenes DSM 11270 TaxID=656914 RepID=A0A1W1UPU3_DESTI|nr:polysaccharide deacetylase [Desulfonispora thiosulfatigenes]SMB83122.1 Peptidoglycan/xylan/chitin deacetylase, PgdA/CDA1 family [Desulfonispora thiosulfatigenes DSM 11270]